MGGHLIALHRMEGCSFFGIDASLKKAVTASQLRTPTHVLSRITQNVPELQNAFNKNSDILTIAGGFPLILDGTLVGGLGVSGGDFDQDRTVGERTLQELPPHE